MSEESEYNVRKWLHTSHKITRKQDTDIERLVATTIPTITDSPLNMGLFSARILSMTNRNQTKTSPLYGILAFFMVLMFSHIRVSSNLIIIENF